MTLSKIIREARKAKGMTQKDLAAAMGVGQGVVSEWESDSKSNPRADKMVKLSEILGVNLLEAMAEVQENWEGPWTEEKPKPVKRVDSIETEFDKTHVITVPEYDIRLSAGGGYVVDEENVKETWVFNQTYIRELRLAGADLMIGELNGDSMFPTLWSGDRILINRSDKNIGNPGIFAFFDTNALVVKRVEKIPMTQDPVMMRVISDNPKHSPYDVPVEGDDFVLIGRVVWFARRM